MTSKKLPGVFLYFLLIIVIIVVGHALFIFLNARSLPIKDVYIDGGCNVSVLINGIRRPIYFGRYVIKSDCGTVVKPVISSDGTYVMFESRLILEDSNYPKETEVNAVYLYSYSQNMVFKAYDYGEDKIEKLAFDKDNNLQISLSFKDGKKSVKTILNQDFRIEFNEEDKRILKLIKLLPEVKVWLGENDNRKIEIKSVSDDAALVRAYEYFPIDNHTETFNWYEYNRLTGNIKVIK